MVVNDDGGTQLKEDVGPDELVRIAHVATRVLVEGRSRVDVANELGISRFKVARLLEAAHEHGLVAVSVRTPGPVDTEISAELAHRLGLRRAIAVSVPSDQPEQLRHSLGAVAADLLAEILSPGVRCWG